MACYFIFTAVCNCHYQRVPKARLLQYIHGEELLKFLCLCFFTGLKFIFMTQYSLFWVTYHGSDEWSPSTF